jgi:hypothetical protein
MSVNLRTANIMRTLYAENNVLNKIYKLRTKHYIKILF